MPTVRNTPIGKRFKECYNVGEMTPGTQWIGVFQSIRRELVEIGLKLDE
jgi:hypothetical protein